MTELLLIRADPRGQDQNNIASAPPSAVSESGSVSHRSGSISNAAGFTLNNGNASNGVNGNWSQANFANANGTLMISTNNDASRNMTGWRARDSPPTLSTHPSTDNVHGIHPPQAIPYTPTGERPHWTPVQNHYEFGSSGQQAPAQYTQQSQQQMPAQTENHFNQTGYQDASQQAQTSFHPPLLAPQGSFQTMNESNFYQFTPQNQTYASNQAQYQQAGQNQAQVQPSPVSAGSYHGTGNDSAINQSFHPPMQFRDEAEFRGYIMNHFPAG